jgi:myo-inositol 2-dehydrogenase/D-chiro-inositol 1-dehydrogenase
MKQLRIGLVGLGRIGKKHAENLAFKVAASNLIAVATPVAEEQAYAREHLGVETVYDSYERLLQDEQVDAVFLVTPTTLHADQIILGLQAGKHVFCEKPVALNVDDCLRVEAEAAKHPELIVCIGFVRRWDPSISEAKEKILAGAIGVPFLVRSQTGDMDEWAEFQIAAVPASGGIFPDMCIHDIDLAHFLLDSKITSACAMGGAYAHPGFNEVNDADNVSSICRLANGTMANISGSRTTHHGHDTHVEIHGTKGILAIGQNPTRNRVVIKDEYGVRNECTPEFFERFKEAFLAEAEDFVDCCLSGRQPRVTLAEARAATEVALLLKRSFQEQRLISEDEMSFKG